MSSAIFVISCWGHDEHRRAIRETWGSLATIPLRFVVGRPQGREAESSDVTVVDAPDDYASLPKKIHALMGGARMYDSILKVDDDTFVAADRLVAPTNDYVGMVTRNSPTSTVYCHGGAGYWLSRRAMEFVWQAPPTGLSEDAYVARSCWHHGIAPTNDPRHALDGWRTLPRASNDRVVSGEFSPSDLRRAMALYLKDDREDRMTSDEYRKKISGRL